MLQHTDKKISRLMFVDLI